MEEGGKSYALGGDASDVTPLGGKGETRREPRGPPGTRGKKLAGTRGRGNRRGATCRRPPGWGGREFRGGPRGSTMASRLAGEKMEPPGSDRWDPGGLKKRRKSGSFSSSDSARFRPAGKSVEAVERPKHAVAPFAPLRHLWFGANCRLTTLSLRARWRRHRGFPREQMTEPREWTFSGVLEGRRVRRPEEPRDPADDAAPRESPLPLISPRDLNSLARREFGGSGERREDSRWRHRNR